MGAFEDFVNTELPRRLSIDVPETGNLPANKLIMTKGVGLGIKLVDPSTLPGSGQALSHTYYIVTSFIQPNEHIDLTTGQGSQSGSCDIQGDPPYLRDTESDFMESNIQIQINGTTCKKGEDVFYVNDHTLYFVVGLDEEDVFIISY